MTHDTPDTPYPTRGSPDRQLPALTKLTPPLGQLAGDLAQLMERYTLESAEIALSGETDGTIRLTASVKNGLSVRLGGALESGEQPIAGIPYVAHYNGEFFWRPTPDSGDFVKSGDHVRSGQLVAWATGESKNISFGLRADQDGIIRLITPHGSAVTKGETVLYYIEGRD